MPTVNHYFNNFASFGEQNLLEDLIIESIRIYGQEMYYIPRTLNQYDDVYGEDAQSSYEKSFPIEIYIKSVDGFSGDNDFMSKFGVEIRDQVIFSVAQRRFQDEVGVVTKQIRPNEGDLIYFPLNKKVFVIRYVQKFEMFYQLGALQTWEMTAELFEYSNELFSTGIPEIDKIQKDNDLNQYTRALKDQNGVYLTDELGYLLLMPGKSLNDIDAAADNDEIQTESDAFIDFSAIDPFSEGNL